MINSVRITEEVLILKFLMMIALAVLCASAATAAIDYAKVDPVIEIRGVWVDAGAIPKTEQGIRQMVRDYAAANINVLFPECICRGYTIYPSRLIERDPRFAGAIDPLPVMIDEAHKHGIEVHPWICVFRVGYTKDKGAILRAHPDWAEIGRDGKDLSANGGYWISPCVPAARDFLASLYAELVSKYPVDGIHLDYIRYESDQKCRFGFNPISCELFKKQYGVNPIDIKPGTLDQYFWIKFRERQVNTFVQRIAQQTRALRPSAVISAAVAPYLDEARVSFMQDWPNWAANRWVDFLTPMSYSTDDGHYYRLINREKGEVNKTTLLAPGVGVFMHKDVNQTLKQTASARELGIGQTMFASSYIHSEQLKALKDGPYFAKAALPFRDPYGKSLELAKHAELLRSQGQNELSDYYSNRAKSLADYAKYLQESSPYVLPTPPPIEVH